MSQPYTLVKYRLVFGEDEVELSGWHSRLSIRGVLRGSLLGKTRFFHVRSSVRHVVWVDPLSKKTQRRESAATVQAVAAGLQGGSKLTARPRSGPLGRGTR